MASIGIIGERILGLYLSSYGHTNARMHMATPHNVMTKMCVCFCCSCCWCLISKNHVHRMQLAPSFNKSQSSSNAYAIHSRQTSIFNGLNDTKQNVNILISITYYSIYNFVERATKARKFVLTNETGRKCEPKYTFGEILRHRQVHRFLKRDKVVFGKQKNKY